MDRETVLGWMDQLRYTENQIINIRPWRYQNQRGAAAGRARIHLAPPDSLRFSYRGPLGKSGQAAVVGQSALWVRPVDDDFGALVEVAPVLWATLGQPLDPPAGLTILGLETETQKVWQYVDLMDTITVVVSGNPAVEVRSEIRRDGKAVVTGLLELEPGTRQPVRAVIEFPQEPSRFTFTVTGVESGVSFEDDVWAEPN